jgi:hypothetical protein
LKGRAVAFHAVRRRQVEPDHVAELPRLEVSGLLQADEQAFSADKKEEWNAAFRGGWYCRQ